MKVLFDLYTQPCMFGRGYCEGRHCYCWEKYKKLSLVDICGKSDPNYVSPDGFTLKDLEQKYIDLYNHFDRKLRNADENTRVKDVYNWFYQRYQAARAASQNKIIPFDKEHANLFTGMLF